MLDEISKIIQKNNPSLKEIQNPALLFNAIQSDLDRDWLEKFISEVDLIEVDLEEVNFPVSKSDLYGMLFVANCRLPGPVHLEAFWELMQQMDVSQYLEGLKFDWFEKLDFASEFKDNGPDLVEFCLEQLPEKFDSPSDKTFVERVLRILIALSNPDQRARLNSLFCLKIQDFRTNPLYLNDLILKDFFADCTDTDFERVFQSVAECLFLGLTSFKSISALPTLMELRNSKVENALRILQNKFSSAENFFSSSISDPKDSFWSRQLLRRMFFAYGIQGSFSFHQAFILGALISPDPEVKPSQIAEAVLAKDDAFEGEEESVVFETSGQAMNFHSAFITVLNESIETSKRPDVFEEILNNWRTDCAVLTKNKSIAERTPNTELFMFSMIISNFMAGLDLMGDAFETFESLQNSFVFGIRKKLNVLDLDYCNGLSPSQAKKELDGFLNFLHRGWVDFVLECRKERLLLTEDSEDFENYSPGPSLVPMQKDPYQVGRNEACPCGSGKKFKKCCLQQYKTVT